jgi:hypothetical protein
MTRCCLQAWASPATRLMMSTRWAGTPHVTPPPWTSTAPHGRKKEQRRSPAGATGTRGVVVATPSFSYPHVAGISRWGGINSTHSHLLWSRAAAWGGWRPALLPCSCAPPQHACSRPRSRCCRPRVVAWVGSPAGLRAQLTTWVVAVRTQGRGR